MYSSVLSVLLMGMLPVASPSIDPVAPSKLAVSVPFLLSSGSSSMLTFARRMSASGMIITDLQSGQVLFRREGIKRRPIGSLTKLMSALIIAENHAMDEVVVIPEDIGKVDGSVVHLKPKGRYTVGDLLSAMLIASANDAADALSRFHSGSRKLFVKEMNERATALGLNNTSFANPEGFDDPLQWSTPQDLAWLAAFVMRNPSLRTRMSMPSETIRSLEGQAIVLTHTHSLLRKDSPIVAGKTGTTLGAGECLLSIVQGGKREYVVVILRSRARYIDMQTILEALAALVV